MFAREFQDATYTFQEGNDDRAPKYVLLPTGMRANRLFVVGTLTEAENIGSNSDYWQGRVVDPTETFFMYAGQYQPDAMAKLESIEPPAYVAVVGKPRTYETDGGKVRSSLTIETITVVDKATRDRWVLNTAIATKERLEAAQSESPPQDAHKAEEIYTPDHSHYRECIQDARTDLKAGG